MPATAHPAQSSAVARLVTDVATALHLLDVVAETFDAMDAVVGASPGADGRWSVAVHFRDPPNHAAVRALIALTAGADVANSVVFETLAPADWVAASLAGLGPVVAGPFVVHGAHDRVRVPANRIGIEIEAALAFGTGHHGTTRGCLLALGRLLKHHRPRKVLDVGTGSGVLAIAAARALHGSVMGSDMDGIAVAAARENARINHVGTLVTIIHAAGADARSLRARGPYDLIMANILLEPLRRLAGALAGFAAPDGTLVLSGLLHAQESAALAA